MEGKGLNKSVLVIAFCITGLLEHFRGKTLLSYFTE